MFKYYLAKAGNSFLSMKIVALLVIFSLFAIHTKLLAVGSGLVYWEYILLLLSNENYFILIFCAVFILLLISIFSEQYSVITIRGQRFFKSFIYEYMAVMIYTLALVLCHIIISLILGLGLSYGNTFTMDAEIYTSFAVYRSLFCTPVQALFCRLVYMILGLSFLTLFIMTIIHFSKKSVGITGTLIIYFMMFFAVQRSIDEFFPLAFFNNYIDLSQALSFKIVIKAIFSEAFISTGTLVLIRYNWWWNAR